MLTLPERLTPVGFLRTHWQKQALFMPAALSKIPSSISRNELAWLATLDDVESRLIFVEHSDGKRRYRTENGPFPVTCLQTLPKRDWTLLVHDVEKHLPVLRALFDCVPFIPDWRIDDIMVSFAAPGGGVGPHKDNYDVFLCQGIGARDWRFTSDEIESDPEASSELALLQEFGSDQQCTATQGDVLYLPPGTAHWGRATRACMTYSIGMRAPQCSDLQIPADSSDRHDDVFYRDPNLDIDESVPGYIAPAAAKRVMTMPGISICDAAKASEALGLFATQAKAWLRPDDVGTDDAARLLEWLAASRLLPVHGMSKIAFDDVNLYVNGMLTELPADLRPAVAEICSTRRARLSTFTDHGLIEIMHWMIRAGAFELPDNA